MPNQPKPLPPICLTKNCRAIAVFFNDSDDRTGFCAECAKVLVDPATFGWEEEASMSEMPAWDTNPKTEDELIAAIRTALENGGGYEGSANALVEITLCAYRYACRVLGVTMFQASWADINIMTKARGINGPWGMSTADKMLYPQYDLRARLNELMNGEWREWAQEEAKKKIAQHKEEGGPIASDVLARWQHLANGGRV